MIWWRPKWFQKVTVLERNWSSSPVTVIVVHPLMKLHLKHVLREVQTWRRKVDESGSIKPVWRNCSLCTAKDSSSTIRETPPSSTPTNPEKLIETLSGTLSGRPNVSPSTWIGGRLPVGTGSGRRILRHAPPSRSPPGKLNDCGTSSHRTSPWIGCANPVQTSPWNGSLNGT